MLVLKMASNDVMLRTTALFVDIVATVGALLFLYFHIQSDVPLTDRALILKCRYLLSPEYVCEPVACPVPVLTDDPDQFGSFSESDVQV